MGAKMRDVYPHLPTEEFRHNIAEWLEMMAAAYAQATNIPPEECQLVVFVDPERQCMVYRVERRQALEETGNNSYSEEPL